MKKMCKIIETLKKNKLTNNTNNTKQNGTNWGNHCRDFGVFNDGYVIVSYIKHAGFVAIIPLFTNKAKKHFQLAGDSLIHHSHDKDDSYDKSWSKQIHLVNKMTKCTYLADESVLYVNKWLDVTCCSC